MYLRQKYKVERIIRKIVTNNKDKSLDEIKRMVKAQIRLEIDDEIASKIGSDEIIKVITSGGVLKSSVKQPSVITKNKENNRRVEKER